MAAVLSPALLLLALENPLGACVFEWDGPGLSLWLCGSHFIATFF
jgi:hypothetical protein